MLPHHEPLRPGKPVCVWCNKRKDRGRDYSPGGTAYHGRFCSKNCAAEYGVSIAQTKVWTGSNWTPAAFLKTDGDD